MVLSKGLGSVFFLMGVCGLFAVSGVLASLFEGPAGGGFEGKSVWSAAAGKLQAIVGVAGAGRMTA